jgi:hypothetical protein
MIHVIRITYLGKFREDRNKTCNGWDLANWEPANRGAAPACYHCPMFNFGKPKTAGDWIVHIVGAALAIFLVWWMLRLYVL